MSELRYALRQLLKNRGFTVVAVVVLGLAVGVNTAVFSLINGVLLRPLPVQEPGALRVLNWSGPIPREYTIAGEETLVFWKGGNRFGGFSYPLYAALCDLGAQGSELFAFAPTDSITARTRGETSSAIGIMVSGSFFAGYQGEWAIGRPILPEDDRPDAAPVVVLTHRWWAQHFDSDPGVVGQPLMLNNLSFTIIGILSREFAGPLPGDTAEVYVPLAFQPLFRPDYPLSSPDHYWLQIMLRLRPGADERQVSVALDTAFRRHQLDRAELGSAPPGLLLCPGARGPWIQRMVIADPLKPLTRLCALVLLTACANVAGLLLARHASREHALAVRAALGASRWRLGRQVLAECALLALAAGGLGLLLACWCKPALVGLITSFSDFEHFDFRLDTRVLGYLVLVVGATVLLIGIAPAFFAARVRPLAGFSSPRIAGAPRPRCGKILVMTQVATSVVLLSGAGLMVRTMVNLNRVDVGFNPAHFLVFRTNAAQAAHRLPELAAFYERLRERVAALPGVQTAAFSDQSHLGAGFGTGYGITLAGRESEDLGTRGMIVSDTFLETMQIPLLAGRGLTRVDGPDSRRVSVVNRAFSEAMFPGQSPLGKTFMLGGEDHEIVGVCGNARLGNSRAAMAPIAYLSYQQRPAPEAWFLVRTLLPPATLGPAIRQAAAGLDRGLVVTTPTTLKELADRQTAEERMLATLGGGLALLALVLACLGLYGLTAYEVTRRTREIGVRLALGARPSEVGRWILKQTASLSAIGAIAGAAASLGSARVVRHYLFQVESYDPATLALAVVLLVGTALLAAFVPARRAARIDPVRTLRNE